MKVGILHLSDLHIEGDNCLDKVDAVVSACSYDVRQIMSLYIVITGDIAKFGRKEEYDKAKVFIATLQEKIKLANSILLIKFVIVPGNHDCCFDNVKSTREIIINNCLKDVIEEEDFFVDALAVQNNFWDFYKEINTEIPTDKISYRLEHIPHIDHKITFHCYNSSWMSKINEEYGGIVIPENKFLENNDGCITVSLFHHPLSWLSPRTNKNNKLRFEEHLINTSNLVLFGHEHDKGLPKNIQQKNNNVIFSGGKALQKDNQNETGFGYFEIDLSKSEITCKVYVRSTDYYQVEQEEKFSLLKKEKRTFSLTSEFEDKIENLQIPLKHSRKEKLALSDIFVFPDLEPIKDEDVIQYFDSKELLIQIKKEEKLKAVLEGDDQSGKTTLLFSIYKNLYDNGFMPIYIRGKYIKTTDVKDIVKKAVKEQYNSDEVDLVFQQSKRVLLFDNLQNSTLNPKHKAILLKNLDTQFDYTVITTSNSTISNLAVDEINVLKGFDKYKIQPLGYDKRRELIEKWLQIGENSMTVREEEILKLLQLKLDEINSLIGNRLMPSYPIFILTLLQGLDSQIFQDFSQTSYAHCYHALITAGLVKEKLENELDGYFNLLKELAFFAFDESKEHFTVVDFQRFYQRFKESYFFSNTETKTLNNLVNANILKFDDEYYSFSYKYIFYYLVAQKIAEEIEQNEKLIEKLCESIHLEKSANILIFLSHHTKAQILLDNIILTSLMPFENILPITLSNTDPFSNFISNFINELQGEMIKIEERNPREEIKKEQQQKDKLERQQNNHTNQSNDYELPQEVIEINQALQTIKILGQIVKNQRQGGFEKKKLIELAETAYSSTFRLIGFFTGILSNEKDAIIDTILDNLEEKNKNNLEFSEFVKKVNRDELRKRITKFLQFISYGICIDGLTNLMFAVGSKEDELYNAVTERIDTPVAKIVTFAIKSYYGKINTRNLKTLFKDVEHNHIATSVLRFYVKRHLYTNQIDREKKEEIIQIAGFKPNIPIRKRLN